MADEMDKGRFEALIAAYGADPKRWPAEEREAALAFAQSAEIDLCEARAIDALLDLAPAPMLPSDLLQARLMRSLPKREVRLAPAVAALAACAVFGLIVGYGAGLNAPMGADVDQVLATAFDSSDQGWIGEDS